MDKYYVIRNKETGFYFRGKGANRWGEYHNQASVYRMIAHAEYTLGWLLRQGEQVEIVPIQIVENPNDIAEVVRCNDCKWWKDCHCTNINGAMGVVENPDWFCAAGERMAND